jgi:uncharacterized protein
VAVAAAATETLGSGLGYRPQFRADLFAHRADVDFLEIIADHYFDASPEKLAELDLLRAHFPIVAHGLDLSIGSAEGVDGSYLEKFALLIERIDPPWWSEHLCFTRAGGIDIGHLAALPFTEAAIDVVARNVERVRARIKAPLILENITTVVRAPGGEMDEPAFLTRVLERTGCGWLCDVANLYTNAVNHGVDVDATFERWPWDRLVQIHYAGGRWRNGVLIDSHDSATSEAVWELYDRIVARAQVKGVILERDERLPGFGELLGEVSRAREAMAKKGFISRAPHPASPRKRREGQGSSASASLSANAPLSGEPTAPLPARGERPGEGPGDERIGLQNIQILLARLFTDATLRRAFFAEPAQTATSAGLTETQARDVAAIDQREVEDFARSVLGKRALDARKALPLTAKVLGNDFDRLLFETIDGPVAPQRHRADAAVLAKRLEQENEPPWIGDLARYEATFLAAARPGAFLGLRRFVYPVDDIARRLRTGASLDVIKPHGRIAVWLRAPGGKLRFRIF